VCPRAQIQQENFSPEKKIRCVLVHDHLLLRQGLRRLLEDEPDLEVLAEAANAAEALQRVLEHQPEIVIADVATIGLAVQDAERMILRESPRSKILFLSMHEDRDAGPAKRSSAGPQYSIRRTSAEQLITMVRASCRSAEAEVHEISRARSDWTTEDAAFQRRRVLTTREREVLKLLAEGRTVRSVAGILGLSIKTVDAHKFNLMRKLGLHNKAELVMWAIQQKLIKIPANM
jgi:two-component system, NarL family, response regulator NreC